METLQEKKYKGPKQKQKTKKTMLDIISHQANPNQNDSNKWALGLLLGSSVSDRTDKILKAMPSCRKRASRSASISRACLGEREGTEAEAQAAFTTEVTPVRQMQAGSVRGDDSLAGPTLRAVL